MYNWDEVLEEIHRNRESRKGRSVLTKKVTDPCPDCGEQLVHQEGIRECLHCGYEGPR